jgi:hypothetical protein
MVATYLFIWMVATSLFIHLDGGHISLYSPGWWPHLSLFTWMVAMSLYSPGWWPCLSLFTWMVAMSLFIHLDGGHVSLQPDDLPDQFAVSDADQLVHGGPGHVFGRHHRAGHRVHVTKLNTKQEESCQCMERCTECKTAICFQQWLPIDTSFHPN